MCVDAIKLKYTAAHTKTANITASTILKLNFIISPVVSPNGNNYTHHLKSVASDSQKVADLVVLAWPGLVVEHNKLVVAEHIPLAVVYNKHWQPTLRLPHRQ
jgi:hypothetical protein